MKTTMSFEGIICPMITPFNRNGGIYKDGVKTLIEFLSERELNGLFICGTYGLGPAMTIEERKKLAEFTVDFVPDKMDVIVQVGSSCMDTTLDLAKHAQDIGADAVASTPLFYYSYGDDAVFNFFKELLMRIDIPVFVYNIPSRVGYGISPGLLKKLADIGIRGIKDTSGDIILFYQYIMSARDKRDFRFLVGTERLLLPSMIAGGHGCVAGLANAFPEKVMEFYKLLKDGRYKEAVEKQFFIIELRDIMYSVPNIPASYAVLKLRGVDVGYPKAPFEPLTDNQLEKLKEALKKKGLL